MHGQQNIKTFILCL